MKRMLLALPLLLVFGCQTPRQMENDAFFSAAVFQALWFDAQQAPKPSYPTGIASADEILLQVPPARRQTVLNEAVAAWHANKNATTLNR